MVEQDRSQDNFSMRHSKGLKLKSAYQPNSLPITSPKSLPCWLTAGLRRFLPKSIRAIWKSTNAPNRYDLNDNIISLSWLLSSKPMQHLDNFSSWTNAGYSYKSLLCPTWSREMAGISYHHSGITSILYKTTLQFSGPLKDSPLKQHGVYGNEWSINASRLEQTEGFAIPWETG